MEKSNIELKNFLKSLSYSDARRARKLMAEACRVNDRKIYNWTNVGIKIPTLYREVINKKIGKRIFS